MSNYSTRSMTARAARAAQSHPPRPDTSVSSIRDLKKPSDLDDRFGSLDDYFSNITPFEAITTLTADDIISGVDKKSRLLMLSFVREIERRVDEENEAMPDDDEFEAPSFEPAAKSEAVFDVKAFFTKVAEPAILKLGRDSLASVVWHKITPELISTQALADALGKVDVDKRKRVKKIDFRGNHLLDDDMPHIKAIVTLLPQAHVVDLSINRFHGIDCHAQPSRSVESTDESTTSAGPSMTTTQQIICEVLILLHKRADHSFLALYGTPFASVDSREFFHRHLCEKPHKLLRHLIFLPQPWVAAKTWYGMVKDDDELIKVVRNAHEQFYALR